jgi:SpoVK/Ycf46/Vps4 family AAA+-type ATPase
MNQYDLPSKSDGTVALLAKAFKRLDNLLTCAVEKAQVLYESENTDTPYRGLQIQPEEVYRLLSQQPGIPLFGAISDQEAASSLGQNVQLAALSHQYHLTPFDIDVILIALAPEYDLRYERIYAFLQDDLTRIRPSVDLALNLLCASSHEKLVHRARFMPESPLIRNGLIMLASDPHQAHAPLLSQSIILNSQISDWLLGHINLDPTLASFCRCINPTITLETLHLNQKTKNALLVLTKETIESPAALPLYIHGRDIAGKRSIAEAFAKHCEMRLLMIDLPAALRATDDFGQLFRRIHMESWRQHALMLMENTDVITEDTYPDQFKHLRNLIENHSGIIMLAGNDPAWVARNGLTAAITIPIEMPGYTERKALWQQHLGSPDFSGPNLGILAQRFRLTSGQIAATCQMAKAQVHWESATKNQSTIKTEGVTLDTLMQAARSQSDHALATFARKVTLNYRWEDLILPESQFAQLQEICLQFTHRHIVYDDWGFGRKLSLGRGLNVLFVGSPGTGKTMASEVIANELGLTLYKIDLSQIVSKYIGETEKNLDRIFTAAEDANAILFFDEADALFGKRSEIKDAHDRYANIEVGYLLQKMEEYEGIAILATNLRGNLDDAFVRRMQFIVEFPFPDEHYRRRIWETFFPQEMPLGEDVDFTVLAREIRVAGGNIKNIGLASAFYAASDGGVIHMPHLLRAAHREHQKLGRSWNGLNGGHHDS